MCPEPQNSRNEYFQHIKTLAPSPSLIPSLNSINVIPNISVSFAEETFFFSDKCTGISIGLPISLILNFEALSEDVSSKIPLSSSML